MQPGAPRLNQDLTGYALLALPLLLLALASREWLILIPLGLALAAHPLLRERVSLELGLVGQALLSLPVALLYQAHQVQSVGGTQFNNSFYVATLALLLGLVRLYGPPGRERLAWLMFLGGLALSFAAVGLPLHGDGDRWRAAFAWLGRTPSPHAAFVVGMAAFGVAMVVGARQTLPLRHRSGRLAGGHAAAFLLASALVAGSSAAGSWGVRRSYDRLTTLYYKMFAGPELRSTGFSGEAHLGSVPELQQTGASGVALRVFSSRAPGYLRGRAFLRYEKERWHTGQPVPDVHVEEVPETGRFLLAGRLDPPEATPADLQVFPSYDQGANYFLPLQTTRLQLPSRRLLVGPGPALRSGDSPSSNGYEVWLDAEAPVLDEGERADYLTLPEEPALLEQLDGLLARLELTPGTPLPAATLAVGAWFQRNYTYKVGISFAPGEDPLVQFLRDFRHGHCELFAASGTLLLRRLGLPARYVTGFVCEEKNAWSDHFVARYEHAHAWIEAFHPERGWITVEFTPPGGVPAPTPPGGVDALLEAARAWWDKLRATLTGGLSQLPARLLELLKALAVLAFGTWPRRGVALALIGLYLWRQRRVRQARRGPGPRPLPDALEQERRRFAALERELARHGLGKRPGETLLEYAARLRAAPAWPLERPREETLRWLEGFALERYGPAAAPPEPVGATPA